MTNAPEVLPGRWESVQTDAGWHLRLVGANGEIVLTSEIYEHRKSVQDAINVAHRTIMNYEDISAARGTVIVEYVDERTTLDEA